MYGCVFGVFAAFGLIAYLDAHFLRPNDYFELGYLVEALVSTLDILSDVVFAVAVSYRYSDEKATVIPIGLVITTWLFVVFPMCGSLMSLALETVYKSRNGWSDPEANPKAASWLAEYATILYLLSFVTGSSFTALLVVNSAAGMLPIFHMGLSKENLVKFGIRKLITVVLFEVTFRF